MNSDHCSVIIIVKFYGLELALRIELWNLYTCVWGAAGTKLGGGGVGNCSVLQ